MKPLAVTMGLLLCFCSSARALPVEVGDVGLRHDLQLLIDKGLINLPLSTMPLPRHELQRNFDTMETKKTKGKLDSATSRALTRMRKRFHLVVRPHHMHGRWRVALADRARRFFSFANTVREEAELGAQLCWSAEKQGFRLRAGVVKDPSDGDRLRLDGSVAETLLANWEVTLGALDRWWGPGWDGSLILSNNARPVPAITIQRENALVAHSPWFSWLGPWRLTTLFGQLEKDRSVPDALFFAMRFVFKPVNSLELGLSHTAQWGGQGRPADVEALIDVLAGNENQSAGGRNTNVTGNHLAGFDGRWASPGGGRLPYAIYGQIIGEDEAGGLPSRYIGLAGVELWGALGSGLSYRWHLEHADTLAGSYSGTPHYGTAYQHSIYRDGYTYKGRVIGHTIGGDGEMSSLGGVLIDPASRTWTLSFSRMRINRNQTSQHTIRSAELRLHAAPTAFAWSVVAGISRTQSLSGKQSDSYAAWECWQNF